MDNVEEMNNKWFQDKDEGLGTFVFCCKEECVGVYESIFDVLDSF